MNPWIHSLSRSLQVVCWNAHLQYLNHQILYIEQQKNFRALHAYLVYLSLPDSIPEHKMFRAVSPTCLFVQQSLCLSYFLFLNVFSCQPVSQNNWNTSQCKFHVFTFAFFLFHKVCLYLFSLNCFGFGNKFLSYSSPLSLFRWCVEMCRYVRTIP